MRKAQASDLPQITEIYNQAIRTRIANCDTQEVSVENRQKWFEYFDDRYPLWVHEEGNVVTGFCFLFPYSHIPHCHCRASVYLKRLALSKGDVM